MTNGGLLQLVAYGAQDVYLTANPQVTFFKQLYRRHSNFAMEAIEQTFNGVANFGKRVTCTIARNGDLIHKMYLQATLPSVNASEFPNDATAFSWVAGVGQALVKQVEIEIGGQLIDRHYGDWLHIWNELTLPSPKSVNYARMVNGPGYGVSSAGTPDCDACGSNSSCDKQGLKDTAALQFATALGFKAGGDCDYAPPEDNGCLPESTLYIPLEFWFNRHAGLALPLIALPYHEVKVNIDLQDVRYLANVAGTPAAAAALMTAVAKKGLIGASLFVDYIYLDTEERRRFAQVAHEYLIEQLQFTGTESLTSTSNKIRLQFNHPVKELVWVVQNPSVVDCTGLGNCPWKYTDEDCQNPTAVAKLQLNGQDRFQEREGSYFNYVQPYQHHTGAPREGINVYSFALKPEDLQPSGSCNFSRIDNATLNLTLTPRTFTNGAVVDPTKISSVTFRIYATNYNVLRIMSGMGGLAYSN